MQLLQLLLLHQLLGEVINQVHFSALFLLLLLQFALLLLLFYLQLDEVLGLVFSFELLINLPHPWALSLLLVNEDIIKVSKIR